MSKKKKLTKQERAALRRAHLRAVEAWRRQVGTWISVLSLGGGLDSFGMLVECVGRGEKPDLVVFADVADPNRVDPGEWPSTYRHVADVVWPFCQRHGIEFVWLNTVDYPIRGKRSLFKYLQFKRLLPGRKTRLCTSAAKVERITQYLIDRFGEHQPIEVWIGFEAGEEDRMANDPHNVQKPKGDGSRKRTPWLRNRINRFPLMEWDLCRCRCEQTVRAAGLPVPRKSACTYCPMASRGDFQTLRRELPATFAKVVKLEANCRKTKSGETILYGSALTIDGKMIQKPRLRQWVKPPFKGKRVVCDVCGDVRATKATGCDWLTGNPDHDTTAA